MTTLGRMTNEALYRLILENILAGVEANRKASK